MALQDIIEQTVTGLGYELVDVERSAGGLLRVTIDLPWTGPGPGAAATPEQFVHVEDCEKVTRQLQFALEVDGASYTRLEVSSPGIDRPLRSQRDFERFAGQVVDIVLRAPIGAAAAGQVSANRKKFRGLLARVQQADSDAAGWQISWTDEPVSKPGLRPGKKKPAATTQVLGFTRDELREARLAPIVSFKGRGAASAPPSSELGE